MAGPNESTVCRIAGNLLSGRQPGEWEEAGGEVVLNAADEEAVIWAVAMARAIVAEVADTAKKEP